MLEVKELVQNSDVIMALLPDELHKEVLEKEVIPFLKEGKLWALPMVLACISIRLFFQKAWARF